MNEAVFAFTVWTICLISIVINIKINDRLGRVLALVAFFFALIVTVGIVLVVKGVIR